MKIILESNKVNKNIYSKLYSDIHYVPGDNLNYFKKEIENISYYKPDYTFFLGDLVDDSIYNLKQLRDFIELLAQMTKYSKVILILGNHDQLTKQITGKWHEYYNLDLVHALKNIGITVLENEFYNDDNLCVYGSQFPGMYYEKKEPTEVFINSIQKISFDNPNKFNILLEHSPKHTFDGYAVELLPNVDLVLAGHYHNGCIPWYVGKFIPGNRGLIDPYKNLFPQNSREKKQITDECYGVISTPVTTFSSNSKVLSKVNKIFIPRNQEIMIRKK